MKAVSCAHLEATFKFDLMAAVVALIVGLGRRIGVGGAVCSWPTHERIRARTRDGHACSRCAGLPRDREVHNYVNREMMI